MGSNKNNIFELCPKERLDMMREVNKCQNKCKLDSSREPLVRPIIRSVSRKITRLGTSFEKFSPKGSKYLSKKKRESTRLIERRKSTLQPSTSRCSKIRKVINFIFLAFKPFLIHLSQQMKLSTWRKLYFDPPALSSNIE